MHMCENEGFSVAKDFKAFKKDKIREITETFKSALAQALVEMGYAEVHLSFIKTEEPRVQEPHLDFKWELVTPSSDEFLAGQSPESEGMRTRGVGKKKAPFKERVPFVVFMPQTEAGMSLELWRYRTKHTENLSQDGEVVNLPYRTMLMTRGDTVHAGGFVKGTEGDPRAHFYAYQGRDMTVHKFPAKNNYTLPTEYETSERLKKFYKHCHNIPYCSPKKVPGGLDSNN